MATARPIFYKDEKGYDSDSDVESVDPSVDLVVFEDTPKVYSPGEDIFLVYYLGKDCAPSSRDWVGLYPLHWTSTKDYVTYEWAPKFPRDSKHPYVRSVLFNAKDLQVEPSHEDFYQFLYITKHSQVIGVSKKFHFHDVEPLENLVCVERPLKGINSLTFIESRLEKGSLNGFELLGSQSGTNSTSDQLSNFHLSKLFTKEPESKEVTSDLNLQGLFPEVSDPVHRTESSDYHLDWLFQQEEGKTECGDSEESRYEKVIFVPKQEYTWAQVVQRMVDICDSQWEEPHLEETEVVVEPVVEEYVARKNENLALYETNPKVPSHQMVVVPYSGAGPLVPYQPAFNFTHIQNTDGKVKENEEKSPDEVLLTEVCTRYFKDTQLNPDMTKIMDMPGVKKLVDLIKEAFTPLASLDLPKPALCLAGTKDEAPKQAVPRRKRQKRKPKCCLKCLAKNRLMRRHKKDAEMYQRQVKNLEKSLEATDNELHLKTVTLEDMSKQLKDVTHDTLQLENMYAKSLREKAAEKSSDQVWLEHTIQALQQENQELKLKSDELQSQVSNLSQVHAERNNEWHMAANQRASFHLATIACQEKTIVNLSNDRNEAVNQLEQAQGKIDKLSLLHKEASETASLLSLRLEELQNEMDLSQQEKNRLKIHLELERREHLNEKRKFIHERNVLTEEISRLEKENRSNLKICSDQSKTTLGYNMCSSSQTPVIKQQSNSCQTSMGSAFPPSIQNLHLVQSPPGAPPSTNFKICSPSEKPSLSCDPAIIEVGMSAPAAKRAKGSVKKVAKVAPRDQRRATNEAREKSKKEQVSPTTSQVRTTKQASKENLSNTFNFFASGLDFFSSLTATPPESDEEKAIAATNIVDNCEPVVTEPKSPSSAPEETPDTRIQSWADWVEEEEKASDIAFNWLMDFSAAWKPKSGKKTEKKTPGHVRFSGVETSPGTSGSRQGKGRHHGCQKRRKQWID